MPCHHPSRADKPVRPARRCKVFGAGCLIAKALLELDQRAGKVGHQGSRKQLCSWFVLLRTCPPGYNILCSRTQRDTAPRRLLLSWRLMSNTLFIFLFPTDRVNNYLAWTITATQMLWRI